MAHWFHRNPLKATAAQNFGLAVIGHDVDAIKIMGELKQSRQRLLSLLPDAHHSSEHVDKALDDYLCLFRGFLEQKTSEGGSGASRLQSKLRFRWSHSMLGVDAAELQQDAVFEVANLLVNVALWHMKHAAMIAASDDLKVEEAVKVHASLRRAGSLFKLTQDTLAPQLATRSSDGADLDVRVLTAYMQQCVAEAQEVTIARAVELKHEAGLISSLAYGTSKVFITAGDSLSTLDQKIFAQWRLYLVLKHKFYMAYAYTFRAQELLTKDKCGEGVRAAQESQKYYKEALEVSKEYSKARGPGGTKAKPEQHAFFRALAPLMQRTLDKCNDENALIYHQKVPLDAPQLELSEKTFGLVTLEAMKLPELSPSWTAVAFASFDAPTPKGDKKKASKGDQGDGGGDVRPVKEVEIQAGKKEPKSESGCVIA